ncbi:hypothetical protein [Deinococcus puniceus]|uniref:CHRD domain-containing protein n=1 Tax=Deinococcus puniceus TaxID=1182568 RepID=A0A172T7Y1_9DEIO|nr:hypothetical protein [Deinococcus puniceus]ANE43139.1 hypothetical protein SU48_04450 [Deinococcus puniceus]
MQKTLLAAAALASLAFSSCGVIPTPAVPIPDAELSLPPSSAVAGRVIYMKTDVLGGVSLPGVLQQVSITGMATYTSGGGNLSGASVFIRSSVEPLPAGCTTTDLAPVILCDPAGEVARQIGTVNLTSGTATPFTLRGPELDAAAKAGHGYIGVLVTGGSTVLTDKLKLTGMEARAKF